MTIGDINAFLGTAEFSVAVLSGVFVFAVGLAIVSLVSYRLLGSAHYGVTVFIGLVFVGCVITLRFGPFFLATDGPVYDQQAFGFAESLRGNSVSKALDSGKEGWPILLGFIYYLLGRVTFVGILVNCLATALSAVFVARTAQLLRGSFSPRALYTWFFCTPLLLLLGPSLLREAACWLGISMLCYSTIAIARGRLGAIWPAVSGAFILITVRTSLAALVLGALLVSWLAITLIGRKRYLAVALMAVVGIAFASSGLNVLLAQLGFTAESIQTNRVYISVDATTGFAVDSLQTGVVGFLSTAVQVVPRLLFGPFPWELGFAPVWIWVLLNTLVWLVLLFLAIRNLSHLEHKYFGLILVVASGLVLLAMSVTLTNYGIVVRMRGAAMIMLLPLVLGSDLTKSRIGPTLSGRAAGGARPALERLRMK